MKMNSINGFDNEFDFVKYLNNKKIKELNPVFRELVDKLFGFKNENYIIKCWRNHYKQKTDIFIKINGIMKGISIKKGMKNSFHVERISDFVKFLEENSIDREIIFEYLKYHYADGSIDGRGKKRLSVEEYKKDNQNSIDRINLHINKKNILMNAINRFVIKGKNSNYCIDALICGEVDDFIWITKDDLINVAMSKINDYSTAVHFGPMTIQPKNRCLNYNYKYEKDRYCIQIKWYNLFDDIIEIMNNKIINSKEKNSNLIVKN